MTTVIMNTINEDYDILKRAVDSYLCQDNIQLIISTVEGDPSIGLFDVEYAILKKSDHPGKSPSGAYAQLNNALPLIKGDHFCYASGNDVAQPYKLELEVGYLKESGKEVCYSAFFLVQNGFNKPRLFHDYDHAKHLEGNFVSDCSLMTRKMVDKYLPFREDLKNYAHWDLWLRIFEGEGDVFVYNSVPTWFYIQNPNDMHILRRSDPEQLKQAEIDRENMLNFHR